MNDTDDWADLKKSGVFGHDFRDDLPDVAPPHPPPRRSALGRLVPIPVPLGDGEARHIDVMDLTPDQERAYGAAVRWLRDPAKQVMKIGGLAGTGKTSLVSLLAGELAGRCETACCAYTGKAASVLRAKLRMATDSPPPCRTIHGLIYVPVLHPKTGEVLGYKKREQIECGLIIVDEGSMVGQSIWNDLCSYGTKILVVGDHGQLPPVADGCINLMGDLDHTLERIHRQAEGSPIISLAHHIRAGGTFRSFVHGNDPRLRLLAIDDFDPDEHFSGSYDSWQDRAVGVYYNRMRVQLNEVIRSMLGATRPLEIGDTVICLKNIPLGEITLCNGMRGQVTVDRAAYGSREAWKAGLRANKGDLLHAYVDFYDEGFALRGGYLNSYQFGRPYTFKSLDEVREDMKGVGNWQDVGLLFDYGYAMTVHKMQGSQYKDVVLFAGEGRFDSEDQQRRWLYTAVTRASERLTVVL